MSSIHDEPVDERYEDGDESTGTVADYDDWSGTPLWKVEVIADSSGQWCGNALTFTSEERAREYAVDLARRWTLVRDWRVVQADHV